MTGDYATAVTAEYIFPTGLFAVTCLSAAWYQPEDLTGDAHLGESSDPLTGQAGSLSVTTANTVVNQYGVLGANVFAAWRHRPRSLARFPWC